MSLRTHLEQAGCTPLEVEAAVLHELGWGYRRIARHQAVAMTTAKYRVDQATKKLAATQHREERRP